MKLNSRNRLLLFLLCLIVASVAAAQDTTNSSNPTHKPEYKGHGVHKTGGSTQMAVPIFEAIGVSALATIIGKASIRTHVKLLLLCLIIASVVAAQSATESSNSTKPEYEAVGVGGHGGGGHSGSGGHGNDGVVVTGGGAHKGASTQMAVPIFEAIGASIFAFVVGKAVDSTYVKLLLLGLIVASVAAAQNVSETSNSTKPQFKGGHGGGGRGGPKVGGGGHSGVSAQIVVPIFEAIGASIFAFIVGR